MENAHPATNRRCRGHRSSVSIRCSGLRLELAGCGRRPRSGARRPIDRPQNRPVTAGCSVASVQSIHRFRSGPLKRQVSRNRIRRRPNRWRRDSGRWCGIPRSPDRRHDPAQHRHATMRVHRSETPVRRAPRRRRQHRRCSKARPSSSGSVQSTFCTLIELRRPQTVIIFGLQACRLANGLRPAAPASAWLISPSTGEILEAGRPHLRNLIAAVERVDPLVVSGRVAAVKQAA